MGTKIIFETEMGIIFVLGSHETYIILYDNNNIVFDCTRASMICICVLFRFSFSNDTQYNSGAGRIRRRGYDLLLQWRQLQFPTRSISTRSCLFLQIAVVFQRKFVLSRSKTERISVRLQLWSTDGTVSDDRQQHPDHQSDQWTGCRDDLLLRVRQHEFQLQQQTD